MKKLEFLGRSLSKDEQKRIMGGHHLDQEDGDGCIATYSGCNNNPEYGGVTCDYSITCASGASWNACNAVCMNGDGGGCR
jgi:hypothetical protein